MILRFASLGLLLLVSTTARSSAQGDIQTLLDTFNVITGDYSLQSNETEGATFVYGSYMPSNNVRFGFNSGTAANDSDNMLWLNNGLSGSGTTTLLSGSLVTRIDVENTKFALNGNAPGTPILREGVTLWDAAVNSLGFSDAFEIQSTLQAASSQWAALTTNSFTSTPGNGSLTFNASPTLIDGFQVAVFDIDGESAFGSASNVYDRLELQFNGAETVLINVAGQNITINDNFTNGFVNNESKILFNFFEAETVTINRNIRAGIFAPNATVNQGGSNFDGTVVAAVLNQNAEIHNEKFEGPLPFQPIPEPSSALLLLGGATLLLRRRR
ncbi:MAG: choice-of-anchor A family protein [Verrucomicrobiota bacterium]